MPMTVLDPKAALVVIDLQQIMRTRPLVVPLAEVAGRSVQLARALRSRGCPVVWVTVAGGAPGRVDAALRSATMPANWSEPIEELEILPGDVRIVKYTWGALSGTGLDGILRGLGVTQIVLTGIATSIGVSSTARSAYELGYNVVIASDAVSDFDPEAQSLYVNKLFPRLGQVDTTENILKLAAE